jgi:DNA (cytosine-5)-methyltransferase 1
VEIVDFLLKEGNGSVLVRRLLRRAIEFPEAGIKPNELVYTDETFELRRRQIKRKCSIRFYTEEERDAGCIPPPYNRNGTANAFYITSCLNGTGAMAKLEPLARPFPTSLKQAFDPSALPPRRPLRGMDLYCGGGNFGRGLEEGGAVRNKWAVDYDRDAIHTYHANLANPEETALYFGSVNDLLAAAINGHYSKHVPRPGEVDFISAGSPCQGFSNANQKRLNVTSLRNSSLVASVAAFIDFYRPKYALLENVINMASRSTKSRDENVFSQLLCSLVGLGYQVQQFNLDAWSFGNPQSRSRLFVSIAAPGLKLPPHPAISHSHPAGTGQRALGVAANGLKFGQRRFEPTPFKFVTAAEGTAHLPWIGDGRTQTCISHPDHRLSRNESNLKRILLTQIPYVPRGQSFITAFHAGRLANPLIEGYCWENRHKARHLSKSWQRVNPDGLMPTITTAAQPSCSFTGQSVHWGDPRLISVEEARIAQGFPEQDVLIGYPRTQWKIVGNSVARGVALALGISLREAWLSNGPDADEAGLLAAESGRQEPCQELCHGPLSAASEDISSPLELRSPSNRSDGVLDSGIVASVAAGEPTGKTPEIPAIYEIATPADSPSKRPYVFEGVNDDDVRPTKVARIAIEVPSPLPRLISSPHLLPTPSPESATVAAASPGSQKTADREAGSATVSGLHANLKRLLPASQAHEDAPPTKRRKTSGMPCTRKLRSSRPS